MVSKTADLARTKKELVTEFRRTTILDAAGRAFARYGYEGTTVDTIAAEAKIAKGTVYLYYKSKAGIYHAAVAHGLEGLYADTEKAMASAPGCRQKIEQFIRLRFDYLERHRDFYRIYLSEFGDGRTRPSQVQKQMRTMYRRQAKLLESVLAEAISKGEIRPMPVATTALAIYDVTRGLLQNRLLGWVDVDKTADVQSVLDLLWNGLRPNGG